MTDPYVPAVSSSQLQQRKRKSTEKKIIKHVFVSFRPDTLPIGGAVTGGKKKKKIPGKQIYRLVLKAVRTLRCYVTMTTKLVSWAVCVEFVYGGVFSPKYI